MTQFSDPSGLDDILEMMDRALGNKKTISSVPAIVPRVTLLRSWLSERTDRQEDDHYSHYFLPPVGTFDSFNYYQGFIIHNHSYKLPCATPHFCFEWGYRPSKDYTFFWLMNGKYYGDVVLPSRPNETLPKESPVLPSSSDKLNDLFSF